MTERLTAKQIAEILGVSRQAIVKRAKKERWPYEEVPVRGGQQRLYTLSALPAKARAAIENARLAAACKARQEELDACHTALAAQKDAERMAAEAKQTEIRRIHDKEDGRKRFNRLEKDDPRRVGAEAKEYLLAALGRLRRETGLNNKDGMVSFCEQVRSGHIALPAWVAEHLPQRHGARHLVWRTLEGWWHKYDHGGIWALVDNRGAKPGSLSKIENHSELYRVIVGMLVKYPQVTPKGMKDYLETEHPRLNIVSQKGIERFFKRFREANTQLWTFITQPDLWKNIYMAAAGSVFEQITEPNQMWELDSTPGDWLLTDGRHSVVGCIDLHTRRVKLFVSKSSTAAAVKQVLRRAMLDWGVPRAIRTDNGKDYVSEEVSSLLRDLEVIQEICIPFASEEKGTIERFFRTMSHGVLNLLEGFIGHNVAERKAIEARKSFAQRIMQKDEVVEVALSAADLQARLDEWVDHYYEQSAHGGLNGQTPREVWRNWKGSLRKIYDPHALDELMAPIAGVRTIGKKGIRYDNRFFFDREGVMFRHVGDEVTLRQDEQDIGRLAVYLDGAFLCWAEDPDATGIDRREYAKAIKHSQKKFMAEQAAELKAFTKEIKRNPAEVVIAHRKAQAGNVTDLPKRAEAYSTPALEAAADAHRARLEDGRLVDTATGEIVTDPVQREAELIELQQFRAEFEAHNRAVRQTDDERRIHADFWRLDAAAKAGLRVSDQERRELEIYKQSGQWDRMEQFFEDFGLTAADFR